MIHAAPCALPLLLAANATIAMVNLLSCCVCAVILLCAGKAGRTAPVRVSHVVMWTNYTANMTAGATGPLSKAALLANLPANMQYSVRTCMDSRNATGLPVWVIADRWGTRELWGCAIHTK